MRLSDGAHTLNVINPPPAQRNMMVSGNGLIVEMLDSGKILTWNEEEQRYVAPDNYTTLTPSDPDWGVYWEPGVVNIGHIS